MTIVPVKAWADVRIGGTDYYIDGKKVLGSAGTIPLAQLSDYSRGALIRGDATEWNDLAVGTVYAYLTNDGTDVNWSTGFLKIAATKTLDIQDDDTTITGGGTIALAGFTLTVPKTGTIPVGTGTAGRIAEWVTDANTLQASTLIKSGAGVLTLSAGSAYTVTVNGAATLNDWFDQSVKQAASPTFADVNITNTGYVGISADVRTEYDSTNGRIDHVLGDAAGADEVRVVDSAGTAVATTDSDGNGYYAGDVGVGTAPAFRLDVVDSGISASFERTTTLTADDLAVVRFKVTSSNDMVDGFGVGNIFYIEDDASGVLEIGRFGMKRDGADNSGAYFFETRNAGALASKLYIKPNGNVLIGHTTDNGYRLDIDAGAMRYAEMTAPSASPNAVVTHAVDNGGVTEYRAMMPSGTPVVLARDGGLATYTPTNVTTDRSYDADSTTVAELADVLGTLIADLQTAGVLG